MLGHGNKQCVYQLIHPHHNHNIITTTTTTTTTIITTVIAKATHLPLASRHYRAGAVPVHPVCLGTVCFSNTHSPSSAACCRRWSLSY